MQNLFFHEEFISHEAVQMVLLPVNSCLKEYHDVTLILLLT